MMPILNFSIRLHQTTNQNAIWGLQDDWGNLIEDDKGLKALGVRYFSKIFKDDVLTNIEAQLNVI